MTEHFPEYFTQDEFRGRTAKLEEIKALGVSPYPHHFEPTASASGLQSQWEGEEIGGSDVGAEGTSDEVIVAGRLVLFRAMGKNAFAQVKDATGKIQIMFNRDLTKVHGLPEDSEVRPIKFIEKKLDLGDIIGVRGHLFRTQKGELTIFAKEVTLLTKALLPLPDKHSGLADKGTRYRKRWLDLIANEESASTLVLRSKILQITRSFLVRHGFLEVETPVLQNIYGGAAARPFETHLHSLDINMFLRISLEIPLKKLLVGGIERVFEIGKVFRNEGIDRTHNPEFTELEAYAAYWDYEDMMAFMESLFEEVALTLFNTTRIKVNEHTIELKAPWKRMTMVNSIKEYAGIDVHSLSDEQMRSLLTEKTSLDAYDIKKATRGKMIAYFFEELVEEHLIQPHHIIDHPIETTPLCKPHREPKLAEEGFVERFETFILGGEYSNSYSELNDPLTQRQLFEKQQAELKQGDLEAHPLDEEFLEALCQGMPPASGIGIGMDRMVMLFTAAESIRDVLYFPIMRPEE